MIHTTTLVTIILMAAVTYSTRVIGFVGLRNRSLSPRAKVVMETAPGCVLISVIAPSFVSGHPADLIALAITVAAAARFSMLPTVLIGMIAAASLRLLIP
jgi:uncharacterized membrane protein